MAAGRRNGSRNRKPARTTDRKRGRPTRGRSPFPLTGSKYQITTGGGRTPVWSPDGRQLFCVDIPSNRIVGIDVRTDSGFSFGAPTAVPLDGGQFIAPGRNYDITPDGKQFIVVLTPSTPTQGKRTTQEIIVVLNWTEELKQRVPITR